jgi:uncharacterized protein (TIGR03437 family)
VIPWLCLAAICSAQPAFFRKDIPIADRPIDVAIGDFNGDSRPDIVVLSWGGLSVLLSLGGGNFAPPLHSEFRGPYTRTIAADFNLDGKLDLFIGGRILLGRGNGAFLPPREIGAANFAATGDLNGDHKPDLVISDLRRRSLEIWLGNGEGFFQTSSSFEIQANQPHVADFNRDGKSDVAVIPGVAGTQNISVFLGKGDGTFNPPIQTATDAWGMLPGDFNRDGLPDIATTSAVLLGNGDGSFQSPLRYPRPGPEVTQFTDPFPRAAADFNGDGNLDLVTTYFGDAIVNHFSVFQGKGDGTLSQSVEYTAGWAPETGEAADLDGDSRPDLIITNFRTNTVTLLMSRTQDGPILRRAISSASGTAVVAPESLATLFASTPAATGVSAPPPWPMRLGGISLQIRDSTGTTRLAPLVYVSPVQINFQVPVGTALGEATLAIVGDSGSVPAGSMQVDALAPGLFMASFPNAILAAVAVGVASDGSQTSVPVFRCSVLPSGQVGPNSCGPMPIPLSGDPIYLSFFGTGFRNAASAQVTCTINGVTVPVEYAGPQGTPGVDQINIRLGPEIRQGGGPFGIGFTTLSINGIVANSAWLQFR